MAENKTQPTDASVTAFIDAVEPAVRREDARILLEMFERITGEPAKMWGPSIIGFGSYHYRYDSGREGDWCRSGFSPRKANLSIHLMGCYCDGGFASRDALMARLGKHKTGASCLYINKLADIDMTVLEELARESLAVMDAKYPHS